MRVRVRIALAAIGEGVPKVASIVVGVGDLRGDGLQKAALYFAKVARLNVPTDTELWSDLLQLSKVRNIVVHADGRVRPNEKKEIQDFVVQRYPEVTCDDRGLLTISAAAVPKLIQIQCSFLKEFMTRCNQE